MSAATVEGQQHLDLCVSVEDRQLIERAAGLAGKSPSEFVKSESLRSARALIHEDAVIRLTERGWEQLADLIESAEDKPNEALSRAAERNSDVQPLAAAPLA